MEGAAVIGTSVVGTDVVVAAAVGLGSLSPAVVGSAVVGLVLLSRSRGLSLLRFVCSARAGSVPDVNCQARPPPLGPGQLQW